MRALKNWLPLLVTGVLLGGLALAAGYTNGPTISGGNKVSRAGDTMTGPLQFNTAAGSVGVALGGTCVSNGSSVRLNLNGCTTAGTGYEFVTGLVSSRWQLNFNASRVMHVDAVNFNLNSTGGFVSEQTSGSNGFACTVAGCRFDFGPGSLDYAASDGSSTVTFASTIATSNNVFQGTSTSAKTTINGFISAANASTTVPAVQISPSNALDANDLIFAVANSTPTNVVSVDLEGDIGQTGSGFYGGSVITKSRCEWRFQEGQTTTLTSLCAAFTETNGAARTANTGDTSQYFANLVTTAADNNTSNILTATESLFSRAPRFSTAVRTHSAVTSTRLWVGMTEADLSGTSVPNTIDCAAFRYDSSLGTDWKCCSSDGATASCTDTGNTVSASTSYKLSIAASTDGATYTYYINGAQVCSKTSNPPGTTQNVKGQISVTALAGAGVAKQIGVGAGALEVP